MQDIYNGLIHCGQIKYIEKQRAKRALVVFGNGENGVLNAKRMNFIGDTKITCKGKWCLIDIILGTDCTSLSAPRRDPTTDFLFYESVYFMFRLE